MISGHPLLRCPFLISKSYIYFNASYACNGIKKKAKLKYFPRQIDLKNLTYPYGSSINGSESKYDCCDLSYNAQCSSMWIKLHDHFWLFHQWLKKLTVFERLFLQLGTRFSDKINSCCSKVAVIERFDKNQSMDCPLWQRKVTGQEVAVSGGSTVLVLTTNCSHCFPIVIELTVAKSMKSNMCGGEKTKLWSIHNPGGNGCLLSPVMEHPRRPRGR